jgi:hypothetical protein
MFLLVALFFFFFVVADSNDALAFALLAGLLARFIAFVWVFAEVSIIIALDFDVS